MLTVTIVPRLPPIIDGVGDYALHIARQLRKDFGIETHFIVGDPTWAGAKVIEGFPVSQVTVRSAANLSRLLLKYSHSAIVLLHYVGHGYAKRGCPFWLVESLEHWRNNVVNARLVSMFHELYAVGPRWTSDFWLSPLQQNLAARLAWLSDRCLTSVQEYAEILYKLSRGKQTLTTTLPVFSNIGEPEKVPPLSKRQRRLVVFGQCGSKLRVYRESLAELCQACQLLEIEEIWDIGPSIGLNLASVGGVPIVNIGERLASEVSDILLNSMAGFFNYGVNRLAKSGIFAAYCSHGLLPINYQGSPLPVDGIEAGKHYWIPDHQRTVLSSPSELQIIADNAYAWYLTHSLPVHTKSFATCLKTI